MKVQYLTGVFEGLGRTDKCLELVLETLMNLISMIYQLKEMC